MHTHQKAHSQRRRGLGRGAQDRRCGGKAQGSDRRKVREREVGGVIPEAKRDVRD